MKLKVIVIRFIFRFRLLTDHRILVHPMFGHEIFPTVSNDNIQGCRHIDTVHDAHFQHFQSSQNQPQYIVLTIIP